METAALSACRSVAGRLLLGCMSEARVAGSLRQSDAVVTRVCGELLSAWPVSSRESQASVRARSRHGASRFRVVSSIQKTLWVQWPSAVPKTTTPASFAKCSDAPRISPRTIPCRRWSSASPASRGDLLFPELVDFVESALRVDDTIFRMTRDRAVMVLSDVDECRAREIIDRLLNDFRERFTPVQDPELRLGFYEIPSGTTELTVKQVLPTLFARSAH